MAELLTILTTAKQAGFETGTIAAIISRTGYGTTDTDIGYDITCIGPR